MCCVYSASHWNCREGRKESLVHIVHVQTISVIVNVCVILENISEVSVMDVYKMLQENVCQVCCMQHTPLQLIVYNSWNL